MSKHKHHEKKAAESKPTENAVQTMSPPVETPPVQAPGPHPLGCFTRMLWMLVGNLFLAICAFLIYKTRDSFFSPADVAFWVIVALMIFVRFLDIRRFRGETLAGKPASMQTFTRYAGLLPLAALVVWAAAHAAAYFSK